MTRASLMVNSGSSSRARPPKDRRPAPEQHHGEHHGRGAVAQGESRRDSLARRCGYGGYGSRMRTTIPSRSSLTPEIATTSPSSRPAVILTLSSNRSPSSTGARLTAKESGSTFHTNGSPLSSASARAHGTDQARSGFTVICTRAVIPGRMLTSPGFLKLSLAEKGAGYGIRGDGKLLYPGGELEMRERADDDFRLGTILHRPNVPGRLGPRRRRALEG